MENLFSENDFAEIKAYAGQNGYDKNSLIKKQFVVQREKLERLANKTISLTGFKLEQSRKERISRQAGQGATKLNWADYILVGYNPSRETYGKTIFLKFSIHSLSGVPKLNIEIDVDRTSKHQQASTETRKFVSSRQQEIKYDEKLKFNHDLDLYAKELVTATNLNIDFLLACISNMEKQKKMLKINNNIRSKVEVLKHKKQIILQGPPGTGKTYSAKDMAEQLIHNFVSLDKKKQRELLEKSDRFKLIQFHPAYSYEDFVRGISAKSDGNHIEYRTENRVVGEFAEKALLNYRAANPKDTTENVQYEQWISERVNEFCSYLVDQLEKDGMIKITEKSYIDRVTENSIRYNSDKWKIDGGVPLSDLIKMKKSNIAERKEIENLASLSKSAKHQSTYWFKILELFKSFLTENEMSFNKDIEPKAVEENYVLIIDEINRANLPAVLGELIYALEYRGESVDSMYKLDSGNKKLVLPPNLFIIGTMNTADRSVGHIDYAIRRRFAFVEMLPRELDKSELGNEEFRLDEFREVKKLFIDEEGKASKHLSSEFIERPQDVWIGHSYFIDKKDVDFIMRLKYEIAPILEEYVKDGILKNDKEVKGIIDKYKAS